ncbi:UNVERIFIED_CONTAM: RNA polymerase subunit sigma-24 [Mumia flava]
MEAGRLIAGLARVTGDLGTAEEMAQDALVVALEQWPSRGVPPNPAGWLMTTAKNRAIDAARRRSTYQRKLAEVGRDLDDRTADTEVEDALDDVGDDLLRLVFTACHPVLSVESRVALTLRCLGGLSTAEIARGFLVSEATMGQRISRAKKTLTDRKVVFALPDPDERAARLDSVLEVVYLIFNEGYAATGGTEWYRTELCSEALRLARVLAGLVEDDPEVLGFVALLELQAARIPARTAADGSPVLLDEQDRQRWDRTLVRRGIAALDRAQVLASEPGTDRALGPYAVQAEIAACHARARSYEETDWHRIAALYTVLRAQWPSPVVEVNRAVAVGMADGPERGLAVLDAIASTPALRGYPQLPAVRGHLLALAGRADAAVASYEQAAELTRNAAERAAYERKAAGLRTG